MASLQLTGVSCEAERGPGGPLPFLPKPLIFGAFEGIGSAKAGFETTFTAIPDPQEKVFGSWGRMQIKQIAVNGTPDRKGKKYPVEVYPARVKGYGVIPIKIYFKFRAKGSYCLVEDRSSGRRRLLNCPSLDAARERANQVAEAIAKGKQAVLRLNRQDLDSYEVAKQSVAPFNVSVHFASQEWAHAKTMLAGRGTLLDAVRFYLDHGGDGLTPKSFNEAKEAFLQLKAHQGISKEQQRRIRSRLDRVAVRFGERPLTNKREHGDAKTGAVGFYLCDAAFADVLVGYRLWWLRGRSQSSRIIPKCGKAREQVLVDSRCAACCNRDTALEA
jgi:hypothetical protein